MARWWIAFPVTALGLWFGEYLAAFISGLWFCLELVEQRKEDAGSKRLLGGFSNWLTLYGKDDALSIREFDSRLRDLQLEHQIAPGQLKILEDLRVLSEIRSYLFGKGDDLRSSLKTAFISFKRARWKSLPGLKGVTLFDVTEAATQTAHLLLKLYEMSQDRHPLSGDARRLYAEVFLEPYGKKSSRITREIDRMEVGLPFVILNLLGVDRAGSARALMRSLAESGMDMSDEPESTLYWMCEVIDFDESISLDYESTIRNLYQLCLVKPERAEFLELDSPYYLQAAELSEMAREGFLFKELFVESVLALWAESQTCDGVFSKVLSRVLGVSSKILDNRNAWIRHWTIHREGFGRDYLWLVEGNLAFSKGEFGVALECFGEATELSGLFTARLNRVLALAYLKKYKEHRVAVEEVISSGDPRALYASADSYLVLGDVERAKNLLDRLREIPGWELKAEYYASVFCLEHRLYESAVLLGEEALRRDPQSTLIRFHLSQVYRASGTPKRALELIRTIDSIPDWMKFIQFQIERDAGENDAALRTLKTLSGDCFKDEGALSSALEFARQEEDLPLLRQLKRYQKR